MFYHFLHFKKNTNTGFGLIELMVSISIMALVSAIVLVKQSSFNGAVLLRGQAYKVALAAREAQLNAVSAVGVAGDYRALVGLHFTTNEKNIFRTFKDGDNNNGFFDADEALGQPGVLDGRFEIRALRVVTGSTETPVSDLSVVFERPDFDARFFTAPNTEVTNASAVEIDIARTDVSTVRAADIRTVEITATGQIIVQQPAS
jgi:prepilin-type N-terminal cleavage/methylation domain-containing protein